MAAMVRETESRGGASDEMIKKIIEAISLKIKSCCVKGYESFDVRDFLVYGGLVSLGYGFYELFPWLGFVSFGTISMLLGLGWIVRVRK